MIGLTPTGRKIHTMNPRMPAIDNSPPRMVFTMCQGLDQIVLPLPDYRHISLKT